MAQTCAFTVAATLSAWSAAPQDYNPAEIVKKALPAVVAIRTKTPSGDSAGTGFLVDPSGTIVTNLHVIQGATNAAIKLANGDVYDDVRVRAFDERKDLAVLQISAFGLPTVPVGNSDGLAPGQRVVLVGNALGVLEGSVSVGVVSGVRDMDQGYKVIQTDATANRGNSGGPMLNEKGEVIGVVAFKLAEGNAENLNFAVPINYARGMLITGDSLSLADLGSRLGKTSDLFGKQGSRFPSRWRSLSSGTTKIVRVDGESIYVETVQVPDQQQAGSFNLAELKRAGDKWVGRGRASQMCSWIGFTPFVGREQKFNRCTDEWPIEITVLSPTRIEGRAYGPTPKTKFDCGKCSFNPPLAMQPFTWIPED